MPAYVVLPSDKLPDFRGNKEDAIEVAKKSAKYNPPGFTVLEVRIIGTARKTEKVIWKERD